MFDDLCNEIRVEFPDFKIVKKQDSRLMRLIAVLLSIATFGRFREFMQRYTTTIGHTVYVSSSWPSMDDASKCILLRHERVHMRQAKLLGRFLFSFLYMLPFFPMGLAYFRAKFEKEAYEESIRATVQYRGTNIVFSKEYREFMLEQFCGPAYGWMWPFKKSINKWFDQALDRVIFQYLGKVPKPARVTRKL